MIGIKSQRELHETDWRDGLMQRIGRPRGLITIKVAARDNTGAELKGARIVAMVALPYAPCSGA